MLPLYLTNYTFQADHGYGCNQTIELNIDRSTFFVHKKSHAEDIFYIKVLVIRYQNSLVGVEILMMGYKYFKKFSTIP